MILQLVDEDEFAKLCKVKQNGPMIHQLLTIDNLRLQISRGSLFFILIPEKWPRCWFLVSRESYCSLDANGECIGVISDA